MAKESIDFRDASNLFLRVALWNVVAAVAFTVPVLIPRLAFPILLTQWGSIYMVLGYLAFLLFGVIGPVCWSVVYYMNGLLNYKTEYDKALTLFHAITNVISAYCVSTLLFIGGYIGARAVYEGESLVNVGVAMEVVEIPAGFFIGLAIISTIVGLLNLKFVRT
ncbi:MAG: hypothetical protein QW410_01295 [Nitrososphaerota archaeon]|nr:hypothetical protein [Candidatus Calditenuis fumarioli]